MEDNQKLQQEPLFSFRGTNRTMPLDTSIRVLTPENIAFEYRLAGPFQRLLAYLIDLFIRAIVLLLFCCTYLAVASATQVGGQVLGIAPLSIAAFLLEWFYGGVFETYWNGQTPGKRLLRLRVVTVEGQPINGLQAVLRNLLRAADAAPVTAVSFSAGVPLSLPTFLLGLGVATCSRRFQRLGDLATGTMVICETRERAQGTTPIQEPEVIRLAESLLGVPPLPPSTLRAVATYVQRRSFFGPDRSREIAGPLARVLIRRWGLPETTDPDHLLAAVYYVHFLSDRPRESPRAEQAPPTALAETGWGGSAKP